MAQLFRVSRNIAIERYLWAIERCRDNQAVWQYLRPMETICAALEVCDNAAVLELDLVDFIRAVETNTQRVEEGPRNSGNSFWAFPGTLLLIYRRLRLW